MHDITEGVQLGLARHKMLYGKRFCLCCMVDPDESEPGKFKSSDNRICPCSQAIRDEIPSKGKCHGGIFCTPEYMSENK